MFDGKGFSLEISLVLSLTSFLMFVAIVVEFLVGGFFSFKLLILVECSF